MCRLFSLSVLLALPLCFAWNDHIQAAVEKPAEEQWAILIGVEKYQHATQLPFISNDVEQLTSVLSKYGYCKRSNILTIQDSSPKTPPTKATIEAQLPQWLAKVGPNDHVLVFFSGHGFRDTDGKLYLAPIDFDPKNVENTGVSIQWVREQVAACKAKFKLVVLDACHAGSEKGEDNSTGIGAKELGASFEKLAGVVTLASSTGEEKSQIWMEKKQSLFSYWLVQGLKGNANTDGDNTVSIDELYKYIHTNVTNTAERFFPKPQTPVRIVRTGTPGVPIVMQIRPRESLKLVLSDMADQLSRDLKDRQMKKVGVLEFTTNTKLEEERLGGSFGPLGQYCGAELQEVLLAQADNKYEVINRRTLNAALGEKKFSIDDLGSNDAFKELAVEAGGMSAVVVGTLTARSGRVVHIRCDLLSTQNGTMLGSASGTAKLIESEWAMLGLSTVITPDDRRPPRPPRLVIDALVSRIDQRAFTLHPLDPTAGGNFNFDVVIKAAFPGKKLETRYPKFNSGKMYVALKPGENYQVWITNNDTREVFMRLLVDGKNTLPEKVKTKGLAVEAKSKYVQAKIVNLAEARAWSLFRDVNAVRGFFKSTGAGAVLNKFLVANAPENPDGRDEFSGDIGIITAAFYLGVPKGGAKSLKTIMGEEYDDQLDQYTRGNVPGPLLGVVHINYVSPAAFK
ncbi:MAG: hypothetical protein COA78_38515 [Blastopirellula sp.]|nr:MAG: hypothetical protein COA78_38515 [Blastopirellula sp.]